jgi:histidinol-phosphatase (PHP family)
MKANYHTHTVWCDGRNTVEEVILSAVEKGFEAIGFSSHSTYPDDSACTVPAAKLPGYFTEVRELAARYSDRIRVLCGIEADYIPGTTDPDRSRYADFSPDYIIGSIHYVIAPDGGRVPVDHTPELLSEGIAAHFNGDVQAFLQTYFAQERDMVRLFDFDIVGHPDLCRKFNAKHPYYDEDAEWHLEELRLTAEAIAESGKLVELNTGAISRGWMDDAYPSATFRAMLRQRGVRFVLNSDSHSTDTLDCAFDRFADAEDFVRPPFL